MSVCFLPVVTRLTSSRVKKSLTLDFNVVAKVFAGRLHISKKFLLSGILRCLCENPSFFSAKPCSLYFLIIFPTVIFDMICFSFCLLVFWYLFLMSAIKASWKSNVFLTWGLLCLFWLNFSLLTEERCPELRA